MKTRRFHTYGERDLDSMPGLERLSAAERLAMRAVAQVFPFRTNDYVVEELIDWENIPNDPFFQLTFPQPDMLTQAERAPLEAALARGATKADLAPLVRAIQTAKNPHPAGQLEHNVPTLDGRRMTGLQHKYRETVLVFPSAGQTCHAYCSYCFRWPQFMGLDELKFASREASEVAEYARRHPEVTDVLITGGDPLVMKTTVLARYVEALLEVPTVTSIRIGTKSLAWWPHRFVDQDDADALLRLFSRVVAAGKNLALMLHSSHPREVSTPLALAAIERLRGSGATLRTQAPVIRHVNDDPALWADKWRREVRLGLVPYYMFVERDTGPKRYFELPLLRALEIFQAAYRETSGLARTVRGPSMSATPGKVVVDGVLDLPNGKFFVLKFLQGRSPDWVGRPFLARFDPQATWLDQLVPPRPGERFFFADELAKILRGERGDREDLESPATPLPARRLRVHPRVA